MPLKNEFVTANQILPFFPDIEEGNYIFYGSPIGGMSGGPAILKMKDNHYQMVGLLHSAYDQFVIFNNGIWKDES